MVIWKVFIKRVLLIENLIVLNVTLKQISRENFTDITNIIILVCMNVTNVSIVEEQKDN